MARASSDPEKRRQQAVERGKKGGLARWAGTTPEDRAEHGARVGRALRAMWANATPRQRSEWVARMQAGRTPGDSRNKLTYKLAEKIRQEHAAGVSRRELCERYGLNKNTVGKVIRRQTWAS